MRLALWQGAGVPSDLGATLAAVDRVAVMAGERGAALLVFPEGFLTGYQIHGLAPDALAGVEPALAEVGEVARRAGLAIVIGTHTDDRGTLRNSAAVFSAAGTEIGRYHKRALFGGWEKATFAAGTASLAFDCADLRVGVAICYDVEFPELVRAYATAGVEVLVAPTALAVPNERVAHTLVPARALENQIFIAYCNRSGVEPGLAFVGLSRICGPRGDLLASAAAEPGLLVADLDKASIAAAREADAYLADLEQLRGLR